MDLIYYVPPDLAGSELLTFSLRSLRHLKYRTLYVVGGEDTFIECVHVPVSAGRANTYALRLALQHEVSEDFMYMDCRTVFLAESWSSRAASCVFIPRGREETAVMIRTTGHLLQHGKRCFDYETGLPMRLSRDIARNVLDEVEGEHAIATLVMNEELDEPHERGVNVNVRQWERTFEPQYSAVRLSDTCMKSPYCLKHLAKISKEKSVHER